MSYGSRWSETFLRQLADKEMRTAFVADQVRAHIALLIRALRENKNWTQAELGQRAGTSQNVISRFEDPDYGKMSLQSLLQIAEAFDLPIWIDIPEWDDWLALTSEVPSRATTRTAFDVNALTRPQTQADFTTGSGLASAAEAVRTMLVSQHGFNSITEAATNTNKPKMDPAQLTTGLANLAAAHVGRQAA